MACRENGTTDIPSSTASIVHTTALLPRPPRCSRCHHFSFQPPTARTVPAIRRRGARASETRSSSNRAPCVVSIRAGHTHDAQPVAGETKQARRAASYALMTSLATGCLLRRRVIARSGCVAIQAVGAILLPRGCLGIKGG